MSDVKADVPMTARAIALRLAVEWTANPKARLDPMVSGDIMQDREALLRVADDFVEWLLVEDQ